MNRGPFLFRGPTPWHAGAACLGMDPDAFFPDRGDSTREAKAVCARCAVRAECLEDGMHERHGVWGGLSERQRRQERARRARV